MTPILSSLNLTPKAYGFIGGSAFPASILESSLSITEGDTVSFTVNTGLDVGTTLYWTLSGVNHSDIENGVTLGQFTTSGTNGNTSNTIDVTTIVDTEIDTDSMIFQLRTDSVFGKIVKSSRSVTINNNAVDSVSGTFSYGFDSTISNNTTVISPVNIYYRRNSFQTIYTAAELTANGAISGATFNNLKWSITNAVPSTRSARGLNIRLFHTSQTNGSAVASPISGESKTTVYSVSDTTDVLEFETVGIATFNFASNFTWDGVNNICVESCTAQNEIGYTSAGAQLIVNNVTAGSRYSRSDSTGTSCATNPTTMASFKPSVEMDYTTDPADPIIATITPSTLSVNEGGSITFNVSMTNFTSGTLYWELIGSADSSDVLETANGSFTISSSSGSITFNISNDLSLEGEEIFGILVRTGSTNGTIVGSSPGIIINDIST